MPHRPRSLTLTLIGQQIASLVILLVVLGVTQLVVLRQVLTAQTANSLRGELSVLAPLLRRTLYTQGFQKAAKGVFQHFNHPNVIVWLEDPHGMSLASPELPPASKAAPPLTPKGQYAVWLNHVVVGTAMHYHGHFLANIWLLESLSPLQSVLLSDIEIYGLAAIGVLAVVAFLGAWSVRRTLEPLDRIINTTEHIAAGAFGEQTAMTQAPDEVYRLGEAVNHMSRAISRSFAAERDAQVEMRRFLADASHELRTPLTAVSGFLELWQTGGLSMADQERGFRAMRRETERMTRLVNQLLALSRLDAAPAQEVKPEPVRLDRWADSMLPAWRGLAGDDLSVSLAPVTAWADPDRLTEVVLNLIDNAMRYGGGRIVLAAGPGPLGARLQVFDEGPGFAPDTLHHVFDRFWRDPEARRHHGSGAGLGLSVVKALIEAHGGRVSAANLAEGGAVVTVDLPIPPEGAGERTRDGDDPPPRRGTGPG